MRTKLESQIKPYLNSTQDILDQAHVPGRSKATYTFYPFLKVLPSFGDRYFLTTRKQKQAILTCVRVVRHFFWCKSTQGMENMRPWNGWQHYTGGWPIDIPNLNLIHSDLKQKKSLALRFQSLNLQKNSCLGGSHDCGDPGYDRNDILPYMYYIPMPMTYLWYRISAWIHGYHKINHGILAKSCMGYIHLEHHKRSASSLSVLGTCSIQLLGKGLLSPTTLNDVLAFPRQWIR